jgi:putative phosphoesterase
MAEKTHSEKKTTIGVISDTHGLLRPEVTGVLHGVDHIVHAGDIGRPEILALLRKIAPVTAVRGNMDRETWTQKLPASEVLEVGNVILYVLHDLKKMDLDPRTAGFRVVIFGHSHRPYDSLKEGILFLNPGSAGPRRFSLPVSMALLEIGPEGLNARFVDLDKREGG